MKFLKPSIILLTIVTIGALGLSGAATFQLFKEEFGFWRALFAVLTLEIGIPAIVFAIRGADSEKNSFIRFVNNAVLAFLDLISSTFLLMLNVVVIVTANILFSIGALGVVFSEQVFVLSQVVIFGAVIPILLIGFTHKLAREIERVSHSVTVLVPDSRYTKVEREKIVRDYLESKTEMPSPELLAKELGVSEGTIKSDIRRVRNHMKGTF